METLAPPPSQQHNFQVSFTERSIVKPVHPLEKPKILALSNLDLLSGRFPVTYLYLYTNPSNFSFASIIESLKCSLAETLSYYQPFAGRIVENQSTSEPEIVCNNNGAMLVEGHANISLKNLDLYHLDKSLQAGKLVSILDPDFPLQVQVTGYTCGGISITFTFDHALGDATAFGNFLVSWSQVAQKKPISCMPDHTRHLLRPRCPPTYHPCLDQAFVKCSMQDILNMPTTHVLLKRMYHVDVSHINWLHRLASADGTNRTKIEAFSAYIWKAMATAIDGRRHDGKCNMGWLVDGRPRISNPGTHHDKKGGMTNYIGNVLSVAVAEASIEELKQGSLPEVASKVHDGISKVANGEHFQDLIDWIECHRPGLMLSKIVLGRGGPTVVLSSGRRFPVSELDFGFGRPVLGTVCSTIEKVGVGYINQRPSGRNDGSWTVSAILWPQLVAALESDSVFQPMSPTHLQF
ncbi:hypothetical protein Tsubulata_006643 [Turnera subulata]|uniref:Transferase family protein n=1 Tax=Turnera subulata TaxID=218843 RepID=A0A9Q0FFM3_9ROSI|nr:hypothetical protein Tsubulata_006643 [Turnera subulata]